MAKHNLRELELVYRPLEALRASSNNALAHPAKQIKQIRESIAAFGFCNPILIDPSGTIIAGQARYESASLAGLDTVPTICLEGLSELEKRAYMLADNKHAENAIWDPDMLAAEFEALIGGGFDIELTGFEMAEVDMVIGAADEPTQEDPIELPHPDAPPVSRLGDLWQVGLHRITCGDSRETESYERLLGEERAAMVFADPPYNVKIQGHVSGLGEVVHREFATASGEMSVSEFIAFLRIVMKRLVGFTINGSIHFQCMDWRHMGEMLDAAKGVYFELKNLCVWNKTNAGMGAFYRSQHELIFAFKSGNSPHINNFGLGGKGRHRSNIWTYAGVNTFRRGRMADLKSHPTVKPIGLVADAILDCSRRGDIVLDPFSGSGTTLLAAARTGRRGAAIEIDPAYVDLAVRRLEKATGKLAVHADGDTFAHKASIRTERGDLDVQG